MFNKIILVGNLTRDIEIRYSQGGMGIAKTAIATSRKFTSNGEKKEEVCFVDVTFFGRSAEVANQYLRKGSKILVEGRLNLDQWVDQNGQKRSKHGVIAESMQMLDTKNSGPSSQHQEQGQAQPYQQPAAQYEQHPDYPKTETQQQDAKNRQDHKNEPSMNQEVPVIDIDEDEIPF